MHTPTPALRSEFTQVAASEVAHGYRMRLEYGPVRGGVTGSTVETRSLLCTYCSFALETSVGHPRRSDLPLRTELDYRFRTSEHPALGPAR
jgi:hypothetical protein